MSLINLLEHVVLVCLVSLVSYLLWEAHQERLRKLWKAAKQAAGCPRRWKSKSPRDCPACQSGVQLATQPIRRDVRPWRECKNRLGRKKAIETQGHACPSPDCRYFGITDAKVHALVGNGRRGKGRDIQTLKFQCCQSSFSTAQYPTLLSQDPP